MKYSTFIMIYLSVFVCLEVSGKGSVFSCVGEYCMKRTTPLTKTSDQDDDSNRQYIICSDDGKGDIECRYASKGEADKEPVSKSAAVEGDGKENINPALAAGDTSDIVNDDSDAMRNSHNATKGNKTRDRNATENATAKVEKMNNTACSNNTKNDSVRQGESHTNDKLNPVLEDAQTNENNTQYGILWMFSKMLDWWSYGYNGVWKLLKSGKCPMPWLTSTRLHCNIVEGDEASWTVMAVSFALFPVLGYICLVRV